jgi:hypothetical protein
MSLAGYKLLPGRWHRSTVGKENAPTPLGRIQMARLRQLQSRAQAARFHGE